MGVNWYMARRNLMPTGIYEYNMDEIIDADGPYIFAFSYWTTVAKQGAGSLFCEMKYEDPGGNERHIFGNNVSLNNLNDQHNERPFLLERSPGGLFQFRMESSDPTDTARYAWRLFFSTATLVEDIYEFHPYGLDP